MVNSQQVAQFAMYYIISQSGGIILSEPERASKIIVSCGCLHNVCVQNNLPIHEDEDWDGQQWPRRQRACVGGEVFAPVRGMVGGQLQRMDPSEAIVRNRLINTRFNR